MPERAAKPSSPPRVTRFATPVADDELEFIRAIEDFKRANDQPFPSWSEVLGIVKKLGYVKPGATPSASDAGGA